MLKRSLYVAVLLMAASLLTAQVGTFTRWRIGGGSNGRLLEVDSSGYLLATTGSTAAAVADAGYATFPRVRIAGGTSGNLAEVNSEGRLLVSTLSPTLYWQNPAVANAADTNYVGSTAYTLPANTLVNAGDALTIDVYLLFTGTAATKTVRCNIGYTAYDNTAEPPYTGGLNIVASSTTATSVGYHARGYIVRTGAATANYEAFNNTSGGSIQATIYTVGGALTWADAQSIKCDTKSSVATGGIATLHEVRVSTGVR